MPSPNITETMTLAHAIVATAANTKINQIGSRVVVGIQQATATPDQTRRYRQA
jgi:hypothetical protein